MADAATTAGTPAAFDTKGKTFTQKVDAFIEDVKSKHNIVITKDAGRTAEWQQKYHVAHMFAYNKYSNTQPAKTETGERTISWKHFSDPKVVWENIKWEDFLKTGKDTTPVKSGEEWDKSAEPDKEATLKHVKAMLVSAHIGSQGTAMVSAGFSPCGEPCKCGAGRSNHLSDAAADLNSSSLVQLTAILAKLEKDKAIDLDGYLKLFGLHRPLVNHPKSPEEWHVEALSE